MFKSLNSPQHQRLIDWLKQQREAKGLSMRALGVRLDTPHSFVGKVEQGERRLDVIEFLQYCDALEASPSAAIEYIKGNPEP